MILILELLQFIVIIGTPPGIYLYLHRFNRNNKETLKKQLDVVKGGLYESLDGSKDDMKELVESNMLLLQTSLFESIQGLFVQPEGEEGETEDDSNEQLETIIHNSLVKFMEQPELKDYLGTLLQNVFAANPVTDALQSDPVDGEKVNQFTSQMMIRGMEEKYPIALEMVAKAMGDDWQKEIEKYPNTFFAAFNKLQNMNVFNWLGGSNGGDGTGSRPSQIGGKVRF